MSLAPNDLKFFRSHVIGQPISHWSVPPLRVTGKSKKLGDFVSWMLTAPVISSRGRSALEPILSGLVEFLPLIELKGKEFFAMNVIALETNVLDTAKSEFLFGRHEPKEPYLLRRASFLPNTNLPAIFKVSFRPKSEPFPNVFVTTPFAEVVVKEHLTGALLTDPAANRLKQILEGAPRNVVPGVTE
jgi:hypothetical protein